MTQPLFPLLRDLALTHQGLTKQIPFGNGLTATHNAIQHLGYVQIDTISVVERAHHHVLWSRIPDYKTEYLNQLVKQKQIFEHWFHAAAYLPMQDYRFALPFMQNIRDGEHRYLSRGDTHLMNEILAQARAEGGIRLRHIDKDNKQTTGEWWNSSKAKRSVEQLFMQGDLMISERHGMEKVFDLTERCLPSNLDLTLPNIDEYARYLFDTTLRAHGVFTWKQLIHLKTGKAIRDAMRKIVNEQLDAKTIMTLADFAPTINFALQSLAPQINAQDIFISSKILEYNSNTQAQVKILSPFDNLVIHRERLKTLFNFDYRIECYVPAPKRQFGYFCLPILYDNQLLGRIDCKAHRSEKRFEVISLHLENEKATHCKIDHDHFIAALKTEIQNFAVFNQCSDWDHVLNVRNG